MPTDANMQRVGLSDAEEHDRRQTIQLMRMINRHEAARRCYGGAFSRRADEARQVAIETAEEVAKNRDESSRMRLRAATVIAGVVNARDEAAAKMMTAEAAVITAERSGGPSVVHAEQNIIGLPDPVAGDAESLDNYKLAVNRARKRGRTNNGTIKPPPETS